MVKSSYRGVAQMARVLRLGRRGRRFESSHPDIVGRLSGFRYFSKLGLY